jgi:hypothetical protein
MTTIHHRTLNSKGRTVNTSTRRVVGIALVALGLVAGLVGSGHAQFVVYDDFQANVIDPDTWRGFAREGTFGGPSAELLRSIEGGRLRLALTSYGDTAGDTGTAIAQHGLHIKQLGVSGGSGFITGLKTTVTVLGVQAQDCPVNSDNSGPRVQLNGTFFNDGSSTGPNDRTGDIQVYLILLKNPATGRNTINVGIQRCTTPTCSPFENIGGAQLATTWAENAPVAVRLVWQQAEQRFRFVANGEQKDLAYPAGIAPVAPPVFDFKQVQVLNFAENCQAARTTAKIDAVFDQIEVRRQP